MNFSSLLVAPVLIASVLFAGCSSSSASATAPKDPKDLDGTWTEVTTGAAPTSTSDDELATYVNKNPASVWELTLSNGSGTLTLNDSSTAKSPCVVSRDVTVVANADGSGSTTEGGTGTLVSGAAGDCSGDQGFNFFSKGTTALQRVSHTGDRLVLMSAHDISGASVFIVYKRK